MAKLPTVASRVTAISGQTIAMPKTAAVHTTGFDHREWAKRIKQRANYTCERCGRHDVRVFADHIIEVVDGGVFSDDNGQCLCGSCHTIKTNRERIKRARQSVSAD